MPVGPTELILVLVIVIIVFGVGKLPEVGGALGKGIKEFRAATKDDEPAAKPKESSEKDA
ncbi:MAG TPA: twin-arginine translocase TatA/TatE family subunit [Chloroflexota bacterium]|nr:twin-arginine translocase TatA/TatE family subunit [Chloroflexota bacterium]